MNRLLWGENNLMKPSFAIAAMLMLAIGLLPRALAAQMEDQATTAPYASATAPQAGNNPANPDRQPPPTPAAGVFTPPPGETPITATSTPGNGGYWGLIGLLGLLGLLGMRNRPMS